MAALFQPRRRFVNTRRALALLACPAALVLIAWWIPSQENDSESHRTEQASVAVVVMADNAALPAFLNGQTETEPFKPSRTFVYAIEQAPDRATTERDAS